MASLLSLINQTVANEKRQRRIDRSLTNVDHDSLNESTLDCSICREPLRLKETDTQDDSDWSNMTIAEILRRQEEGIVPEIPVRLSCGHIFGKECITRWIMKADTCPICCLTTLAPPIVLTPELQDWRRQREEMFQHTQEARWRKPSTRVHILAQRVVRFIQRETSYDEIPHESMRSVCSRLAQSPDSLVDGSSKALVDGWEHDESEEIDEMLRWLLEWKPSEDEVERVTRVVRAELAECAAILRAMPVCRR